MTEAGILRNYNEFPQFARMSPQQKGDLIAISCLSKPDAAIAQMRLIDGMDYIEIAPYVNMDRTGVSKRLRKIIVPKIELFMENAGAESSGV